MIPYYDKIAIYLTEYSIMIYVVCIFAHNSVPVVFVHYLVWHGAIFPNHPSSVVLDLYILYSINWSNSVDCSLHIWQGNLDQPIRSIKYKIIPYAIFLAKKLGGGG